MFSDIVVGKDIRTLSLYSTLMMLQFKMEIQFVGGRVMTLVTVRDVEGGMASPTSFKMSLVLTFVFPSANKVHFVYKQYLGLISRDDLF